MHEFELQPIGIGEEQRVVAFAILRIVGWGIENSGADRHQELVQSIDVTA